MVQVYNFGSVEHVHPISVSQFIKELMIRVSNWQRQIHLTFTSILSNKLQFEALLWLAGFGGVSSCAKKRKQSSWNECFSNGKPLQLFQVKSLEPATILSILIVCVSKLLFCL